MRCLFNNNHYKMSTNNPYVKIISNQSDEDLFDIIQNETENQLLYEAAVQLVFSRGLISKWQNDRLLQGDTSALDFSTETLANEENQANGLSKTEPHTKEHTTPKLTKKPPFLLVGILAVLFLGIYFLGSDHNNFIDDFVARLKVAGVFFMVVVVLVPVSLLLFKKK